MRLGRRVLPVGSGDVRDNGLVEALLELALQTGDATVCLGGCLALGSLVFHALYAVAHLELELLHQRGELHFEFAGALPLLQSALGLQPLAFAFDRLLARADVRALFGNSCELCVQVVEEAGDVGGLRGDAGACGSDHAGIEPEPLRDIDAAGRAGHAHAQLVGGSERALIEADGRVDHAPAMLCRVDLQRREVGGDHAPRAHGEEAFGNGDGKRRAFFRVGRGAKLVEQHERTRIRLARDLVYVRDVRGEGGEIAFDRLRVADVGIDGGEDRQACPRSGHGQTGLCHQRQQAHGLERDGLTAGIGATDDELL